MNSTMRRVMTPVCCLALISSMGCTYGAVSKIYATSGSDISLTEMRGSEAAGVCEYQKEPALFIEKALQAASMVNTAVASTTGVDIAEKTGLASSEEEPPCVAFTIHEQLWFGSGESIDVQKYLREEFGSGYSFRGVSVDIHVSLIDSFINLVTLGIGNCLTVEISGEMHPRT